MEETVNFFTTNPLKILQSEEIEIIEEEFERESFLKKILNFFVGE